MKSITTIMKGDESGELVNINAYDAYGIANETNIGRFQYTGQIALPELGLYHYKARVYSPTLGRFLQTDPIGYEDQVNLYAYVGNDPVNFVDPTGMQTVQQMQLEMQIKDMRQQGLSEEEINTELRRQAELQGEALLFSAGPAPVGIGIRQVGKFLLKQFLRFKNAAPKFKFKLGSGLIVAARR